MKIDNLTGSELAMCFGTSHASVSQFKKAGMPHKNGKYNLPACLQWRIARAGGGGESKENESKDGEWLEEYRKQKAKIARLELRRLRGDLVPAGDAELVIREAVGAAKASFLAMPRKLAARLVGKEPREIEAEMTDEIREILMRLSKRKMPQEKKHETAADVETPEDGAGDLAPARKTDCQRVGRTKPRAGRSDKRRGRRVAK